MKLIPILLKEAVDLSDLNGIDDLLAQEIEKAEKENKNEILGLTTASTITLAIAIPGFLNGMIKIVKGLMTSSGIDLTKRNTSTLDKVEDFIEFVATKINQYVDYPIDAVLKKTIEDTEKRKKIKGAIKVGIVAVMIIYAGIKITDTSELIGTMRQFSSEIGMEVIKDASKSNAAAVKKTIVDYIKSLG